MAGLYAAVAAWVSIRGGDGETDTVIGMAVGALFVAGCAVLATRLVKRRRAKASDGEA